MTKPAQVAIVIMRRTIRVFARERAKALCARPDLCLVTPQDSDGLLLRAGDIGLYHKNMVLVKRCMSCGRRGEEKAVGGTHLFPARWSTRAIMFDQDVTCPDFLRLQKRCSRKFLDLFRRELFRWFPHGLLRLRVEEIRHLS